MAETTEQAPLYDPTIHTVEDGDPMVFVEVFCKDGKGVHRQKDPVSKVLPYVQNFVARHSGPMCGAATKAEFAAAREDIRRASATLAGEPYEPRQFVNLAIDNEPRPWPVLEG